MPSALMVIIIPRIPSMLGISLYNRMPNSMADVGSAPQDKIAALPESMYLIELVYM